MLHAAAQLGNADLARGTLARGLDVDERDNYGFTPIILAASGGHVEVVSLLLDAGANINFHSQAELTALDMAASNGHTPAVRLLLERGADVEGFTRGRVPSFTPLMWAASFGNEVSVAVLLAAGADPKGKDEEGKTALKHLKARIVWTDQDAAFLPHHERRAYRQSGRRKLLRTIAATSRLLRQAGAVE